MAPKGLQWLQSGPKWAKMQQTMLKPPPPQKALPPYNPTQCPFQAFPGHKYPSGALRGPSKATQYPSGPLLHLWGGLKGLGRAKKGPQGLFRPFQGNNCLKFSPKKGQNRPKWVKMLSKLLKTQSKGAKRIKRGQNGLKGVKIAAKWVPRLKSASNGLKMGSRAFNWLKIGQNRLQLAQNRPKWYSIVQNRLPLAQNRPK